jgi:hypothetical protein
MNKQKLGEKLTALGWEKDRFGHFKKLSVEYA